VTTVTVNDVNKEGSLEALFVPLSKKRLQNSISSFTVHTFMPNFV